MGTDTNELCNAVGIVNKEGWQLDMGSGVEKYSTNTCDGTSMITSDNGVRFKNDTFEGLGQGKY